jgi:archaetidylinositol phosphate synthase
MPVLPLHRRDHRSLLAAAEKRLLIYIARRLPPFVNSDHLSLLGLAAIACAGLGFALMRVSPWGAAVVVLGLVVNWFGDSLDGTVARVRGHERPRFGYYVDHVIDLAGSVLLFAGLAASGLMTPLLAVAVMAGYLLVSAETYLATHAGGVFTIAALGIGPTELRILLIAGALYAVDHPSVHLPWGDAELLFDVGGAVALAGFIVLFITAAVRQTLSLAASEPRPSGNSGRAEASGVSGNCVTSSRSANSGRPGPTACVESRA